MFRFFERIHGSILLMSLAAVPCLAAISFEKHTVQSNYAGPWSVYTVDIDGDTDMDMVSAGRFENSVDWWENDGDQNFTRRPVSSAVIYPMGVHADDYDGDGDMDIVCAADVSEEVSWFENDGNQNFTKHQMGHWPGVTFVWGADVDLDGDPDVLAAACEADPGRMGWFENDGNGGFTEHVVIDDWDHANCVHTADIDSDGDIDLLGSASWAGQIAWFENNGEQEFTPHIIFTTTARPSSAHGTDLDKDGDTDILATVCVRNQILWFENDGNQSFTEHVITTGFSRPHCVWSKDLDLDGDIDILATAINGNEISWFENDGNQGMTKHILSQQFGGATDVFAADVDRDGDLDILGAAQFGNELAWWESNLFSFRFRGEPISGHAPLLVQFTDLSSALPPLTFRFWDFDSDGTIDSEEIAPLWSYDLPGSYTVCLEVGHDSLSNTMIYEDYIRVFDGESAIELDGQDGHGVCDATEALNLTEELTVEAWINPGGWGEVASLGYGRIADKGSFALSLHGEGSIYNDFSLMFVIKNETGPPRIVTTPVNSMNLESWQHVAATYDGVLSSARILIDGTEQELTYTAAPQGALRDNLSVDLLLGNSESDGYTFDGIIDEVRLWNRARTGDEIRQTLNDSLSGDEDGLIGYWPMDEGNGFQLFDHSDYGHDVTLLSTRWAQGIHLSVSVADYPDDQVVPMSPIPIHAFPNPFIHDTTISYHVPHAGHVRGAITDICGKQIRIVTDKIHNEGVFSFVWDGRSATGEMMSSGFYFARLEIDGQIETKKIILLR